MANFFKSLIAVALGVTLGLFATWLAVERGHGYGSVHAGPWTGWPRTGTQEADPYARAVMARTGEVPLGLAEGLTFIAATDSNGERLNPECTYRIASPIPVARYWSITLVSERGALIGGDGERHGITSSELVRNEDGSFAITLARNVHPGNWLAMPRSLATVTSGGFFGFLADRRRMRIALMLRLYDTPVSATASALSAKDMPTIERLACP